MTAFDPGCVKTHANRNRAQSFALEAGVSGSSLRLRRRARLSQGERCAKISAACVFTQPRLLAELGKVRFLAPRQLHRGEGAVIPTIAGQVDVGFRPTTGSRPIRLSRGDPDDPGAACLWLCGVHRRSGIAPRRRDYDQGHLLRRDEAGRPAGAVRDLHPGPPPPRLARNVRKLRPASVRWWLLVVDIHGDQPLVQVST